MQFNAASGADPDGILLVDKPSGMTSSDVVVAIRRMFKLKKVGHGGTLDPQATGLLAVLVGKATRASQAVMGGDKVYEGTLRLGESTNTQDADGERTGGSDPSAVTREALEEAVRADFTGDIFQTPPMVSAIKVNGVPLYKMARKGEEVAREPRLVHVYAFKISEFALPDVKFTVSCTKGTYVRTLCNDIGEKLGCGGHLAALRRIGSGRFSIDGAISWEALRALPREALPSRLLPLSVLS